MSHMTSDHMIICTCDMYTCMYLFFLFQDMVGMLHVGVFILLMLSGERNFGVRLNKPYPGRIRLDIPRFTGSHADLMFLVRIS